MRKDKWIQLGRAKCVDPRRQKKRCVDPSGKRKGVWIQGKREKVFGSNEKEEKGKRKGVWIQ